MYLILSTFFSRFDMDLYDTDAASMEWVYQGLMVNRADVKVVAVQRERGA